MTAYPLPELRTPALVLADLDVPSADGVTVSPLGSTPPAAPDGGWASIALVAADEIALRRAASTLPALGRCRQVAVVLRSAAGPVTLVPRQEWPAVRRLDARWDAADGAVTTVDFAGGPRADAVLLELARSCGLPAVAGGAGLVGAGALGAPLDPVPSQDDVPPTVVLAGPAAPVTTVAAQPPVPAPDGLGEPLDEAVLNPAGYERTWSRPVVDLDGGVEPTAALVASLRDAHGVRLRPGAPPRLVAALALAGVPVADESGHVPADPFLRELGSLLARRAAYDEHSVQAWRARLASVAGVRHASHPSVTVVLTAASDRLGHARRQLDRQRGVELDVVEPGGRVRGDVVLTTDAGGWWGPEVVLDLLRARRWSGAGVVEMPVELAYVEDTDETVRLDVATERSVDRLIAGSLALVDRPLLHLVGRPDRAALAGATTYRTHGLAHVARLTAAPADHVLRTWPGLLRTPLTAG